MAREIELRRHTDADGDALTAAGVAAALEIGAGLCGGYDLAVSSGAQRATQTLACFLAALDQQVPAGVVVEPGLRSSVEEGWRAAYHKAGSGALEALREADPSSSPRTRSASAPRSAASSTACPTMAGPWSSGTALQTKPPSWVSPARSWRRCRREPAFLLSPATTATRSNPSRPDEMDVTCEERLADRTGPRASLH